MLNYRTSGLEKPTHSVGNDDVETPQAIDALLDRVFTVGKDALVLWLINQYANEVAIDQ